MKTNNTIVFGKPYLSFCDGSVFLNSDVLVNGEKKTFWFKYDKKYADYLVVESNDGFVLSFLPYCLKKGIDIKSEAPLNEVFKYQIEEYLIPTLVRNISTYNFIKIDSPLVNEVYHGNGVATGISCGVDSSYTILKNLNTHSKQSGLNINYVTFFNAGSSGSKPHSRFLFEKRLIHAEKAAKYLGLELLCVETNINEIYIGFDYESVHSYRTLGIPLTLQKLFKHYYYSSSFTFENFKFDDKDPTYHDLLTMSCISTPSLAFTVVGSEVTRIEKTKFISTFEFPKHFLNVCVRQGDNCSCCFKCIRTMLDLYLIGQLDEYKEAFDIEYFYNNFDDYIVYAIEHKTDIDMPEIYEELLKRKIIKRKHMRVVRRNKFKRFVLNSFAGKIYKSIKNRK